MKNEAVKGNPHKFDLYPKRLLYIFVDVNYLQ